MQFNVNVIAWGGQKAWVLSNSFLAPQAASEPVPGEATRLHPHPSSGDVRKQNGASSSLPFTDHAQVGRQGEKGDPEAHHYCRHQPSPSVQIVSP